MIKLKSGYSVVELIVAMTLFVTVVAISSSTTLSVLKNNRTIKARQQTASALDLVMEEIVRNARVGEAYESELGGSRFKFVSDILEDDEQFTIELNSAGGDGYLTLSRSEKLTGSSGLRFTPNIVNITKFDADVSGVGADKKQPSVKIFLEGIGKYEGAQPIQYQTVITQRKYEQ